MDADHDNTISLSEFLTTLIDWNQLQKEHKWQVSAHCHAEGSWMTNSKIVTRVKGCRASTSTVLANVMQ